MIESQIENFSVLRVSESGTNEIKDTVAREFPVTVIVNNKELVTLLCTPSDIKYLAIGFLTSEGLVKGKDEIKKILVDDRTGVVRVDITREISGEVLFRRLITSGCGRGAAFSSITDIGGKIQNIESSFQIATVRLFDIIKDFQKRSEIYLKTGGVHSAALCTTDGIIIFKEDVGRHNAVDKIFGECILKDIAINDHIILTSGRMSSEIVLKVANRNVPILVSRSAPTNIGLKAADDLGITMIGFARGKRMNVYTHKWRVITGGTGEAQGEV